MDSVEQMFKQHYAFVCNVIHMYVRDRTKTEDIAQEIFAELWIKRDQLHIHTSVPAYLRRMAVTRSLNYIRDTKRHAWEELEIPVVKVIIPGLEGIASSRSYIFGARAQNILKQNHL